MIQGSGFQHLPPLPPQWYTPPKSTSILHPPILPFPMSPQLPVWLAPTVRKLHPHAVVGESYTVILQPIQGFVVLRLISSWPWPVSNTTQQNFQDA